MDPSHQRAVPSMEPSRVAGGMAHSASSSGIFFQGDGQSQFGGNSHLTSSFGNSSSSAPGIARRNLGLVAGDVSNNMLNSVASSAPSMGASSLVTDANSGLSGGPQLQRSASINTESYMRLPASPLSFSSNNISISGSSVMDGSSVVQQSSNLDSSSQQIQQHQGNSSATSRLGQVQLPNGPRIPGSLILDPGNMSHLQKKPRLDIKQEDVMQQQVLQQMLPRQQNPNPQLQVLIQQQRLRQQQQQHQQLLQSLPPMQRAQLIQQHQQHQQLQLRQQIQQQGPQPVSAMKRPYDGGVCSRRLMQYLYHQRQRPPDNSITYWRKFVAEYFSPRAKKRWCLSTYDNVGHHSLGVFPQASVDAWQCDICGSKSGRGFEATFEVLPRLNEIKFGSGVIDDLLFLDMPRENRFPSGMMMLEYAKAVQESVYEQLRVVREGRLRIIFTPDLKILTWEFCARRHEELISRRIVAPQVNHLLQVAQKWQSTMSESGPDGVSQQELQANSNMVVSAGRQLTRSLEMPSLNDLGFSKRYIRCLQIAEVVNTMNDLMGFCREQKAGPIEALKSYPRHVNSAKIQMQKMQEMEQVGEGFQGLPTDRNTVNKLMAQQISNNQHLVDQGASSGSAQAALALTNYQHLLMRRKSMNSNLAQQEASSSFNNSIHSPSSTFQGPPSGGFPGSYMPQQPQPQQRLLGSSGVLQQNHHQTSQGSEALQQQMIQQMLQDMRSNSKGGGVQQQSVSGQSGGGSVSRDGGGVQQPSLSGQSSGGNVSREGLGFGNGTPMTSAAAANGAGNITGPTPSRSNSFNASSNIESSAAAGGANTVSSQKAPDLPMNLHLSEDEVPDLSREFTDGFFDNDLDDMDFGWKA